MIPYHTAFCRGCTGQNPQPAASPRKKNKALDISIPFKKEGAGFPTPSGEIFGFAYLK